MSATTDRLYNLLPVIYRLRDAEQGEQLRALLGIINGELSQVEDDIAGLYRNWFIETSDEWVVPYLGDLLGVRGLNTIQTTAFSQRAYVANTLYYRRRKGTADVLETLAGDVTGWPAQVVEFFELLQTTQYLNHRRLLNTRPDLRNTNQLNLLDTPFDSLPHTADVRHINNRRGKHNIPNLGVFLWRLQNYPMDQVMARQAAVPHTYGYHFSPLGNPAPLFNTPADPGAPDEQRVPAPIRPFDFYQDLKSYQETYGADAHPPDNSRYYGPQRSLQIVRDGTPVPPKDILCKNLSAWAQPPAGKVAVDVGLGRIAFAAGETPAQSLQVSYNYGFSADLGGGPYDRRERLAEITPGGLRELQVGQAKTYATLAAALTDWADPAKFNKSPAVIRIYDSGTYTANLAIDLPPNGMLVLDCENEERPTLVSTTAFSVTSAATTAEETAAFSLSGLLIEGSLEARGKLNLSLADCTLVPGLALDEAGYPRHPDRASLVVTGPDVVDLSVSISRCILGPLELPAACLALTIVDSVVVAPLAQGATEPARAAIAAGASGAAPGPLTILNRVSVFGKVHVGELSLASEVIFNQSVIADRRQAGCVRFSYIPEGSQTPRRFRCQPDLALAKRETELDPVKLSPVESDQIVRRVRAEFTSPRYGEAAFAQLSLACAGEIKAGAEDGSEMGVFRLLQQPQREANLRIALDEYLRFGLEAGIFYVT
jgi:hypothetical protein